MKTCFVISPIGPSGSEIRQQSDAVLEHIIAEALKPLGYSIERADTIAESGLITFQIIERITTADLVIADLSRHNANVFYELAIRHVTGKPFIQLIEQNEKIPFDVANARTIMYTLDLNGAKRAREELCSQVSAINQGKVSIENPISVAIDIRALASSEDPVKSALHRIESELSQLREATERSQVEARNVVNLIFSLIEKDVKMMASSLHENSVSRLSTWPGHERTPVSLETLLEREMLIKSMWDSGASSTEIAKALGTTRSAIVGKIYRMGLSNKEKPENSLEEGS